MTATAAYFGKLAESAFPSVKDDLFSGGQQYLGNRRLDLVARPTGSERAFDGMEKVVLRFRHQFQIFYRVVGPALISVVYLLITAQRATEMLCEKVAMVKNRLAIDPVYQVASGGKARRFALRAVVRRPVFTHALLGTIAQSAVLLLTTKRIAASGTDYRGPGIARSVREITRLGTEPRIRMARPERLSAMFANTPAPRQVRYAVAGARAELPHAAIGAHSGDEWLLTSCTRYGCHYLSFSDISRTELYHVSALDCSLGRDGWAHAGR